MKSVHVSELQRKAFGFGQKLVGGTTRLCDQMLGTAWVSYALISVLQLKVIWKIWAYRDLTTGDTSSYFTQAYQWYPNFSVNIVWSPLYTAFYGTALSATENVYAGTILHRVIIVMAATLGVLALMRRLLPPALALFIAAWWAILPINFDALYEIHLFALLPILGACLVTTARDSPWTRGSALAILLATAILVRNEIIVAVGLFGLICLCREYLANRLRASRLFSRGSVLVPYGVPAIVAICVCAFFYWRSVVKFPQIFLAANEKHTLSMCQAFAFGYSQRHPEWNLSPWLECGELAKATFNHADPTLLQMIWNNPSAAFDHFLWNLSLTVNGFQVSLFNAMSGTVNPDYVPVRQDSIALVLSLVSLAVVVAAIVVAKRNWIYWWENLFRERRDTWLIMLCILCVAVPVIITQRPRPSYLFSATVVMMAVLGTSILILLQNRWHAATNVTALLGVVLAIFAIPSYYVTHRSDRPLYSNYERLKPFGPLLAEAAGGVLLGDYNGELRGYLRLEGRGKSTFDYGLLNSWNSSQSFNQFLDGQKIDFVFIQPRIMPELLAKPEARAFLENPEAFGWRRVAPDSGSTQQWLLLQNAQSATPN